MRAASRSEYRYMTSLSAAESHQLGDIIEYIRRNPASEMPPTISEAIRWGIRELHANLQRELGTLPSSNATMQMELVDNGKTS